MIESRALTVKLSHFLCGTPGRRLLPETGWLTKDVINFERQTGDG